LLHERCRIKVGIPGTKGWRLHLLAAAYSEIDSRKTGTDIGPCSE
jgi:hypothetical protein